MLALFGFFVIFSILMAILVAGVVVAWTPSPFGTKLGLIPVAGALIGPWFLFSESGIQISVGL